MSRPLLLTVDVAATMQGASHSAPLASVGASGIDLVWSAGSVTAIASSGFDVPVRSVSARCASVDPGECAKQFVAALDVCVTVGAGLLNLAIPPVGEAANSHLTGYRDGLNFAHALLRELRFEAECRGIRLALVAPSEGCLVSPVEVGELLDAAHSSGVGACVDVARASRVGRIEDWLATLGRRVAAIRVTDVVGFDVPGLKRGLMHIPPNSPAIVDRIERCAEVASWVNVAAAPGAG